MRDSDDTASASKSRACLRNSQPACNASLHKWAMQSPVRISRKEGWRLEDRTHNGRVKRRGDRSKLRLSFADKMSSAAFEAYLGRRRRSADPGCEVGGNEAATAILRRRQLPKTTMSQPRRQESCPGQVMTAKLAGIAGEKKKSLVHIQWLR